MIITIPWSQVFLETLIVVELDKKFPASYGSMNFIVTFTRAHHWIKEFVLCGIS